MANAKNFKDISISIASADDIHNWSFGEVKKPETINYRTLKPERDGLFCERIFGPTRDWECACGKYKRVRYKGVVCERCGVEVTLSSVRRERMGHIELVAPVSHIWFFKGVPSRLGYVLDMSPKTLEKVIYFSSYMITSVDEEKITRDKPDLEDEHNEELKTIEKLKNEDVAKEEEKLEKDIAALEEKAADKKSDKNAKDVKNEISVLQAASKNRINEIEKRYDYIAKRNEAVWERFNSLKVGELEDDEEIFGEMQDKYGDYFEGSMGAEAVKAILDKYDVHAEAEKLRTAIKTSKGQKKIRILKRLKVVGAFEASGKHPSSMILTAIPVIPPDIRPMIQLDGGRFATSDLNDLYRRVINRNNRLRRLIELNAPQIIVNNEKRMLQESVDALFDNGRRGRPVVASNGRPLKSLSETLKGKQGRFRQNLLGKRVDYSGRSVIVVGPTLKMHECGLPKQMALELFKPFVMRKLVEDNIAQNIKVARRMIEYVDPAVWAALEEVITEHPVLLNRAPTLHRLGIQAFQPQLVEGKAIHLHPLACAAFNADFDGDQMAVHLPLSYEAQAEARILMLSSNNLLKPADGRPVTLPSQDMVIGIFYLSKEKKGAKGEGQVFANVDEAMMAYDMKQIDLNARIKIRAKNLLDVFAKEGDYTYYDTFYFNPEQEKEMKAAGKTDEEILEAKRIACEKTRKTLEIKDQVIKGGISDEITLQDFIDSAVSDDVDKEFYEFEKIRRLDAKKHEKKAYDKVKEEFDAKKTIYIRPIQSLIEKLDMIKDRIGIDKLELPDIVNFIEHQDLARTGYVDEETLSNLTGIANATLQGNEAYSILKKALQDKIDQIVAEEPDRNSWRLYNSYENYIIETTLGRVIFNEILPYTYRYINCDIDKKMLDSIVNDLVQAYPTVKVNETLDAIKNLGFRWASKSCVTIAFSDVPTPKEKPEILAKYDKQSIRINERYENGLITDEERHQELIDLWTDAGDEIAEAMRKGFTEDNTINRMVGSGARGNWTQVRQISGMRGLVSNPKGEIIPRPIKSNYRDGLSVLEYFMSSHGARKGLADTALRTADSGYLTRRLVDVSQDVIIKEEDCGTAKSLEFPLYVEDETGNLVDNPYTKTSAISRSLAEDVVDENGELLASAGDIVSDELIATFKEHGIDKLFLRTVLTCNLQVGVCAKCYGASMSSGETVDVGEAVGVIAAQSIGEPGTQLTMRTFHTGGVANADDITQGLPRVAELFEARTPKGESPIAEYSGKIKIEKDEIGVKIVLKPDNSKDKEITYQVSSRSRLNVADGDHVEAGHKLIEGAVDPKKILNVLGTRATQNYLLDEVQEVYRSQGVNIHDKHIEIIVSQMMKRVTVLDSGDTTLLPGEMLTRKQFQSINREAVLNKEKPATARPELMGITKAALMTDSWLSSASFQETTRALTDAANNGRKDYLHGLKENVIIGKLIPAGTGIARYKNVVANTVEGVNESTGEENLEQMMFDVIGIDRGSVNRRKLDDSGVEIVQDVDEYFEGL